MIVIGVVDAFTLDTTTSKIQSMDSTLIESSNTKKAGKTVVYLLIGTDTGALVRYYKAHTDTVMYYGC